MYRPSSFFHWLPCRCFRTASTMVLMPVFLIAFLNASLALPFPFRFGYSFQKDSKASSIVLYGFIYSLFILLYSLFLIASGLLAFASLVLAFASSLLEFASRLLAFASVCFARPPAEPAFALASEESRFGFTAAKTAATKPFFCSGRTPFNPYSQIARRKSACSSLVSRALADSR